MKRRDFLKNASVSGMAIWAKPLIQIKTGPTDPMNRIGLTTVVFRNRFRATSPKNIKLINELTLDQIPEFFTDRFGVHNIEIWANHFESTSPAYLHDLKKKLEQHQCKLIDIQAEGKYDISDPLEENRQKGIIESKEWIAICATLGSDFIRIKSMNKSYPKSIESLKEINEYAKKRGVKVLIENHLDLFSDTRNHLNVIKDIPDDNLGLLADFANYPHEGDIYPALKKIAPFSKLVSAKTKDFNEKMEHISHDFGQCIDIFEKANYKGIYSAEQWGSPNPDYDYEKIADWMIASIKDHINPKNS